MQCKYLHSSNEHLSSNLKLPLEHICNFVAKKQKESKGETRRRRERNTSIFYTFAVRQSLRFPPLPGCGFDKKLKHFAVSPNVFSSPLGAAHTQTAREAGPNQAANLGCCSCALCHGELPLSNPPTPRTHTETHSHVFSLRATAIVWQLLPSLPSLPSLHCPLHNLSYELSACCPCQLRRLCCLIVTPARKAKIFRVRMPTLRILHV